MTTKKFRYDQRGFTLLLAALVASIVLMLGSSIFSIVKKQVTLSSIGRDSQFAFYAADTAAECALYYDIRFRAFGSATTTASVPIVCDKNASGGDLSVDTTAFTTGTESTSTFQVDFFGRDVIGGTALPNLYCAKVTIAKNPTPPYTVIHSDGYSTSCANISLSARALQRSIELNY